MPSPEARAGVLGLVHVVSFNAKPRLSEHRGRRRGVCQRDLAHVLRRPCPPFRLPRLRVCARTHQGRSSAPWTAKLTSLCTSAVHLSSNDCRSCARTHEYGLDSQLRGASMLLTKVGRGEAARLGSAKATRDGIGRGGHAALCFRLRNLTAVQYHSGPADALPATARTETARAYVHRNRRRHRGRARLEQRPSTCGAPRARGGPRHAEVCLRLRACAADAAR